MTQYEDSDQEWNISHANSERRAMQIRLKLVLESSTMDSTEAFPNPPPFYGIKLRGKNVRSETGRRPASNQRGGNESEGNRAAHEHRRGRRRRKHRRPRAHGWRLDRKHRYFHEEGLHVARL